MAFALILCAVLPAAGDDLTPGNIIVSNSPFSGPAPAVLEFTPDGQFVQQIDLPTMEGLRDLVVDNNGNIQIYNGTFNPVLTTLNPATNQVLANTPFPGWSTVNNLTYGHIAAFGNYVFVTDMFTYNGGEPNGMVRFDINDLTGVRFGSSDQGGPGDTIALNIGLDGLLYALSQGNGFNGGGTRITVFDPETLDQLRSFDLPVEHRAIAVDASGDIYGAERDPESRVNHYDPNGVLLASILSPIGGHADIDITPDGLLLIGSHGGEVLITDTALSTLTHFVTRPSNGYNFSAWVQPPSGS